LSDTLQRVPTGDGGTDLYIDQSRYHQQFAADLDADTATLMAVTQRPVTEVGLTAPAGRRPLWASVPSWFIFGELDRNIPAAAHRQMAARASARSTVEIPGASHVVGISHATETAAVIADALASAVVHA
jgi:pimeloyl-ACP methyl ester carboxylesterase